MENIDSIRKRYYIIGEIGVHKDKLDRYCHYAKKIERLIENNEPIPTAWIQTLLSYYVDVSKVEKEYLQDKNQQKIDAYVNESLEYFAKHTKYLIEGVYLRKQIFNIANFDFKNIFNSAQLGEIENTVRKRRKSTKDKNRKTDTDKVENSYSLSTLLRSCIVAFLAHQELSKAKIEQKDALVFFYQHINKILDEYFGERDFKKFTDYQRRVLAAYLTVKVAGYMLSEKVRMKFSNPNLFQATRNLIKN